MQMKKFRLQNYKKIEDSGWIECNSMTVFVGKNEAGKSALFKGLSKINSSDGEAYRGLKEFPRKRFTAKFEQQDWPVSSVLFELDVNDVTKLQEICSVQINATEVTVIRNYSGSYQFQFEPKLNFQTLSTKAYIDLLMEWKKMINDIAQENMSLEEWNPIKSSLNNTLEQTIENLETKENSELVDSNTIQNIANALRGANANPNSELEKIIGKNESCMMTSQTSDKIPAIENWIKENMPHYVYFDRYDVIDSAIRLNRFLAMDKDDTRYRITRCFFDHVGLDPKKISDLNPSSVDDETRSRDMADERDIRLSSASSEMTARFAEWWEQRRHKFRYAADGDFFRIWVSDDLDPSEIELEERSAGMRYFFSFYLVFLTETTGRHKNAILLLDEPGLQYHGTAQAKLVKFLRKLSSQNQLLYSTHSPFMIDGDHLEDVRIVYEDLEQRNTQVSANISIGDKDSLFPLQAGLGYAISQTLFYSNYNLVVEGLTDLSILKAMNELLTRKNMSTLNPDIVITPAGGTRMIMPLASLLIGNGIKLAVLLDGDMPGIKTSERLKEKLSVNCILMSSFTSVPNAEIEDMFPIDLYQKALVEAYPDQNIQINKGGKPEICITNKIQKAFELQGMKFEKWKVANVLVEWIRNNPTDDQKITLDTCKKFAQLFDKVNKILKPTHV